ncbi:retrotransposon protein, putative, ty1-copia subclass [Tanacetum coccineum]|uniref:Retrotransposon protein, putative, ty1-copia subclass n=1 Tax=Tanacetum coccineum TaxID=301880 RepID=A0ABQ4ZIR9_9ASTR
MLARRAAREKRNVMSPIWSKNYTGFAIGKRYLPIESIIASRSTDVMMDVTQTTNNNSIRSIVKKEKLNGSNFLDWYRNLRIVLRNKQKFHHLEEALPEAPPATTTAVVRNAYTCRVTEQQEVACLMLQAEQELFETVKAFHACKQEEGQSVSTYVLKMKAYLDQMERLGYPMPLVIGVNMILTSLLKDCDQFVQNYNMHDMGKTIPKLHAMLKLIEKGIPKKTLVVLAMRQGQIQKPKSQARGKGKQRGKGKSKLAYDPKHKIPPPAKKQHPAKDTECHHCHKTGHWKRNSPLYLAELKKNKASTSGTSGIFTIELFSFPKSNTWIYDTGCGTHICNTIQGLRGYRKLNKGALDLYVGNGNTAAVEAIGSFDLILPSGIILVLDNFSKDNIVYFNAFPRDGIFEIDMHNHMSNERSIYTCSNKKTKHNLDSTFLWHCRLGHINKKSIMKLQHDGLLESIDDESFDVCVSCISGKMARKHFTHTSERVDDLLGIIHSDVCRPFRTTSREGANYYVTFTDDFSRYGYVYLIKHKHEVFEMFKTFQNEVENQLGNAIKALLSDRGGEYLSQEFLDHLRSRGIISQLTPPYTPQHNGVSERRNRTLLDMDPESEKWLEAMNAEMQSMKDKEVWNLVHLPPNCKTAGSKWLFKKKTDMDGNIHTYKACLVAKAAYYGYEIWQMDVKTAFLNGRLNKDVYMVQPEWFVNHKHPRRVCKLQRCIYGLKQAYRSWNKRFDEEINKMDTSKHGTILMQPNVDLGKSQGPSTPAEVKRMKGIPYASVVGSIMYAVRCTRPDVAFSQKLTSRYQQNPRESHWTTVKNILKYLRNTKDMFLVYGGVSTTELGVTCYTDAMSSMEAEYIAAMEAIWIHKFIFGLGVVPIIDKPMDMYCDNTSAITIADEPGVQKGAKHFRRKYHFICEVIQEGDIRILKVHTDNNLADPLTKPMPCTKHVEHARSIRLRPTGSFL